jgi:uncharacterized membrane protein
MKYMLLIYGDEQALNDAERQKCYGESAQLAREFKAGGPVSCHRRARLPPG